MKVFLGGTVNRSKWRDYVIPKLKIEYFDPVVDVWSDEAYEAEMYEKRHADYNLYVITPKITGYFAIAEAADDAYQKPDKTIFCYLKEDEEDVFNEQELKTLEQLGNSVQVNGAVWLSGLDEVIEYLNKGSNNVLEIPSETQQYSCFISYGRKHSKSIVESLKLQLEKKELTVWVDLNENQASIDQLSIINNAILASRNFIFVISPHSVNSEYCLRDLDFAIKHGKNIIPLMHITPDGNWNSVQDDLEPYHWFIYNKRNEDNIYHGIVSEICKSDKDKSLLAMTVLLAYYWDNKDRSIDFLLSGKKRKQVWNWYLGLDIKKKESLPELLKQYMEVSFGQDRFTRILNFLSKKLKTVLEHKQFEYIGSAIALVNPISMFTQLLVLVQDYMDDKSSDSVSVVMFTLFFFTNIALLLRWIKLRNKGMFISSFLSILIVLSIIIMAILNKP